ncbi:MAG: hypothetical protein GOP50_10145 [Candidatus Heimdallarchaeota archaeon]|nr:hypothetical protein [Candidatus Heimdallarchaeota archaeon]
MQPENLVNEMNRILVKMDKELHSLNKELDKILRKYPKYIEEDEVRLKYAMRKYNHGK